MWTLAIIDFMQIGISLAGGLAVAGLLIGLFGQPVDSSIAEEQRFAAAMGLRRADSVYDMPTLAPIMGLIKQLAMRLTAKGLRDRVRRDLVASGNPAGYTIDEYIGLCVAASLGFGLICTAVTAVSDANLILMVAPLSLAAGFYFPLVSLREKATARLARIGKQMPYTLDLISLMISAGSTFTEAVETVIREDPEDDFNQELAVVLAETDVGTPRAQALRNLAERIPLDAVRSVVGAINQSEQLGTPLARIIDSQTGMIRTQRSVRAEKTSASASLRLLLPGTLILIAVTLCVFGPVVIRLLRDGF